MDMVWSKAFYALKSNVTSIVNFYVFRTGIFQQSSEFEHCVVNIRTQFLQPWRFRQHLTLRHQRQPTNYRHQNPGYYSFTSHPKIRQFHDRCLLLICVNRLLFCVVRCGQCGHWNCGSLPHSNRIWLIMFFLQRYTFPHLGHWNDPDWEADPVLGPDHLFTLSAPQTPPAMTVGNCCSSFSNCVIWSSRKLKLLL